MFLSFGDFSVASLGKFAGSSIAEINVEIAFVTCKDAMHCESPGRLRDVVQFVRAPSRATN
jgi:hypothetical protein